MLQIAICNDEQTDIDEIQTILCELLEEQTQLEEVLAKIADQSKAPLWEVSFEILESGDGSKNRLGYQKFNIAEIIYFEYTNCRVRMKLEDEEYYFQDKMSKLQVCCKKL